MFKGHILLALTALTAAGTASAQTTTYSTRAAFNAAAGTTTFESFEVSAPGQATRVFGILTATESGGSNSVFTDSFAGSTDGNNSLNYVDNGSSVLTLTFSQLIYSLGFDVLTNSATTIAVGGATSTSLVFTDPGRSNQFFGITSSTGFTTLTFNASGTPSVGIDALAFSTVAPAVSAVPEPASWAMMIGGFGVVGGAARRRRSQRVKVAFA